MRTQTDLARRGNEGRAKVRRLTRTEIDYTIQDLFALPGMTVHSTLGQDAQTALRNAQSGQQGQDAAAGW